MEQCTRSLAGLQVLKWSLGGCVPLTGSQLSALAFFGHGSSPESMCLTAMSTERLFSKNQKSHGQRALKFYGERERESGCLVVILLGLVNYIVKAPPSLTTKYRRSPVREVSWCHAALCWHLCL